MDPTKKVLYNSNDLEIYRERIMTKAWSIASLTNREIKELHSIEYREGSLSSDKILNI
jgi:hypothetical protein